MTTIRNLIPLCIITLILGSSCTQFPKRKHISLNGEWELAVVPAQKGIPNSFDGTVPVPGLGDLEIEVPVILINDLNKIYELDLTILWSNDSGEEALVTESISIAPLEKRDLLYELKTPDSEGRYELIARFTVDDETISSRRLCSITRIP